MASSSPLFSLLRHPSSLLLPLLPPPYESLSFILHSLPVKVLSRGSLPLYSLLPVHNALFSLHASSPYIPRISYIWSRSQVSLVPPPPQWYASQCINACGEPNHQVTSQLNCSRFSPHAFHLGKKIEVFVAEGSPDHH